jgi:hypothetical protein
MSSFPINLCFGHLIILQNTLLYSSFRLVQIVLSFVAFFLCFKIIYLLFTCLSITTVPYLSRVGILFLVQRETHGRLLASLFKILMLLVSSTPYESSSLSDLIFFNLSLLLYLIICFTTTYCFPCCPFGTLSNHLPALPRPLEETSSLFLDLPSIFLIIFEEIDINNFVIY